MFMRVAMNCKNEFSPQVQGRKLGPQCVKEVNYLKSVPTLQYSGSDST